MKDSFDVTADIISLIDIPAIKAMITGGIYADARPDNSELIDIVVNCFGINNIAIQKASPNINIYAPNLPSGSKDLIKLRAIAKAIFPLIDTQFKETFHTDVDDAGTLSKNSDGTWFYNIPVNYYSVQTNFKNI
jgi:hypothetical protein